MKRVTLLRHAKSSWDDPALADSERPLAGRGKRDSKTIARLAVRYLPPADCLLVSDARRTRDTAVRLQKYWPVATLQIDASLYLATPAQLWRRLRQLPPDVQHVVIVGHHPGLSQLAVQLTSASKNWLPQKQHPDESVAEPTLVTAALMSFGVGDNWRTLKPEQARLDTFITPADGVLFAADHPPWFARLRAELLKELQRAQALLALSGEPSVNDVHALRVALKNLRAGLRLLRDTLGEQHWYKRDQALRQLAACYGVIRDIDIRCHWLADAGYAVEVWRDRRVQQVNSYLNDELRRSAATMLGVLASEMSVWQETAISNSTLYHALQRSYRKARKFWMLVDSRDNAQLHRARTLAKRVQLQGGLLQCLSKRRQKSFSEFTELLGEQHDCMLMMHDPALADRYDALRIAEKKLRKKALAAGDKLFAGKLKVRGK